MMGNEYNELKRNTALFVGLIVVLLYLCYSSTFLTDYLTNDEMAVVGKRFSVLSHMKTTFFVFGRGLFGLYQALVYNFVGFDSFRIQLVRFANFFSLVLVAIVLFRYVTLKSKSAVFALMFVLFFYAQPAFHGLMGYSLQLISNSQPAIWLSLLSFYLHFHFFVKRPMPGIVRYGVVLIVFLLAMQSTQSYAFFSVILVATLLLFDRECDFRRITSYLLIGIVAFVLSFVAYKIGIEYLHSMGREGYKLGEHAVSEAMTNPLRVIAKALNPFFYWSAFKFWNYPFPFHDIKPIGMREQNIADILMVVWMSLVAAAIYLQFRSRPGEGRRLIASWLLVLVAMGLGALFLVADSPTRIIEHRPNMTLILSGLVILTGGWAMRQLAEKISVVNARRAGYVVSVYVILSLFGAQADTAKNLVNLRADQLKFIKAELSAKPEG